MRAILIAAIAGLASMAAQAQVKESISITEGQQTVLQLSDRPFSTSSVGNTDVLEAVARSERVIVLVGKKPGLTDVILFDNNQSVLRQITVTVRPTQSNVAGVSGLVLTHNKPKLPLYTAYICDPICRRASDSFQCADCADTTSQITTQNTNTNTNTTLPP